MLRAYAKYLIVFTLSLMCLSEQAARADFILVEDFDQLTLGPIDEQNDWIAQHDTSLVAPDPADELNQVLAVTTDSTYLYKHTTILDETVRVLFVRFRFAEQQIYSFGMSDFPYPDQFGHFDVEISMSNAMNELRINDGGTYDGLTTLSPNTWYNLWLLIDNYADQTQVYLHDRPGEAATPADLLDVDGQTMFEFRDGSAGDLLNFFIKTGGGSGPAGPLYIDDIYLEDTNALNLSNPAAGPDCPGDLDGDGTTGLADLAELLGAYGATSEDPHYNPDADFDASGTVDLSDLAFLLSDYGCGT